MAEFGRRTGLRIRRGNPWGFKSPLSHHCQALPLIGFFGVNGSCHNGSKACGHNICRHVVCGVISMLLHSPVLRAGLLLSPGLSGASPQSSTCCSSGHPSIASVRISASAESLYYLEMGSAQQVRRLPVSLEKSAGPGICSGLHVKDILIDLDKLDLYSTSDCP